MVRLWLRVMTLMGVAVMITGCGSAGSRAIAPVAGTSHVLVAHHIKTVFLVVMENHNWSSIKGAADAPYINHVLLPRASYARQYYNPPGIHPSLPNYLWLEAGTNCFRDTGCITDDGDPASHATGSHAHLVALLQRAGISWRAYEEGSSGSRCPVSGRAALWSAAENGTSSPSSGLYAAKHDPFVYFTDVTASTAACVRHIRPFSELAGNLQHDSVARYNFITPDLCDDMHDACLASSDAVRQGDKWLARVIPGIQRSAAYRRGGLILITWDEGEGSDGPIGLIALSPFARGHGYSNSIHYTHSSTLRTVEEIFGLHPLLGGAARDRDLRALFRLFP